MHTKERKKKKMNGILEYVTSATEELLPVCVDNMAASVALHLEFG